MAIPTGASHLLPERQTTPGNRVLPEKLKVVRLVKKFPAFYGNGIVITVFIRTRHWSLS
jgi:hypothetical protein